MFAVVFCHTCYNYCLFSAYFSCSHTFIWIPYCNCLLNNSNNLVVSERNITLIGRFFFSFSFSHKLQVQLNDHVVAKGDRTGHIRYIGHLDKQTQPNLLFTGLELDSPGQSTLKSPHTIYILRQVLKISELSCLNIMPSLNVIKPPAFFNNQKCSKSFTGITTVSCRIFAYLTTDISDF